MRITWGSYRGKAFRDQCSSTSFFDLIVASCLRILGVLTKLLPHARTSFPELYHLHLKAVMLIGLIWSERSDQVQHTWEFPLFNFTIMTWYPGKKQRLGYGQEDPNVPKYVSPGGAGSFWDIIKQKSWWDEAITLPSALRLWKVGAILQLVSMKVTTFSPSIVLEQCPGWDGLQRPVEVTSNDHGSSPCFGSNQAWVRAHWFFVCYCGNLHSEMMNDSHKSKRRELPKLVS